MILEKICLENIRSYESQEIEFPNGSFLLSGDIGSGKSTILLAIDFALFGLQRDLSGASLLRHSKESGSVELLFSINGRKYAIKRTLRRKADSVQQSSGHITENGIKRDLTAQESKSFILELLGYPLQALRKDSALVYRYTVYTPQDQMRHIIEADPDDRLSIVRRLFGLDRYKAIADNAEIIARELRLRTRELSGSIADLDEKKRQLSDLKSEASKGELSLKDSRGRLAAIDTSLKKSRTELDELQERIESVNKKKQEYASLRAEFDVLKADSDSLKSSINELDSRIKDVEKALHKFKDLKKPELNTADVESRISRLEAEEKIFYKKRAFLEADSKSLLHILEKGVCGTCKQNVSDKESFKAGIDDLLSQVSAIQSDEKRARLEIDMLKKTLTEIRDYESQVREFGLLNDKKKDLLNLSVEESKKLSSKLERQKTVATLANTIAAELKSDDLTKTYRALQTNHNELTTKKEGLLREESSLLQLLKGLKERTNMLQEEIEKKEQVKNKIASYTRYDGWLREFFVKLMGTIERHVMASVQYEFNTLFQKWFSMLVMDEDLSARIDTSFSVVIEQGGFITDYSFLSGGERTAVALAYRLALNRVINDLTERIKTKDLLILDEPTDGFSNEQMNSVRDVLTELKTKQTIIVSHEPRVESFVDNTIRFVKENGISRAVFQ